MRQRVARCDTFFYATVYCHLTNEIATQTLANVFNENWKYCSKHFLCSFAFSSGLLHTYTKRRIKFDYCRLLSSSQLSQNQTTKMASDEKIFCEKGKIESFLPYKKLSPNGFSITSASVFPSLHFLFGVLSPAIFSVSISETFKAFL